ncbi:MAG: dihydroxyacetone kinase subunit DhaL [Christensenellales bacterium]|jgi:dihydroxyacetone kinase-like protein
MITKATVIAVIKDIAARIDQDWQFLTDLDQAIGDGDHGINLHRGFTAVLQKLPEDKDIGTILKTVGMTLVSTVGGASGPIYGTAFMKMGMKLAGKEELSREELLAALDDAVAGIKQRGHAERGEKTILDALEPALEALKSTGSWDEAVKAAEAGVEYTKTIIATKGRASYLGERSLGHQDPGATSVTLMIKACAAAAN